MCLKTIRKCLQNVCLMQKRLLRRNIGKNLKAVQKPSGNGEFSASMFWSHPKWLQMSGFNDFLPFCFQNTLQNDAFMSWDSGVHCIFFFETELRSPEKIKQKKTFFCTLFAKNVIFATRLRFVNRQLLVNSTFLDRSLLTTKCYRIIEV